uniref:Uncharacterized protein At4g22160 n=1 Tax=Anthurium amnicola TaxID=1678845 RepID=A0A1D1XM83_9ARAE
MSAAAAGEEVPPSPPQSPMPSSYAAAAADDDTNPNPLSSPGATSSSANSEPSLSADVTAVVALARPAPSPSVLPPAAAADHRSSSRRLPPPCWTHEETEALIQSYRHKWYALRRGNLRASHWEEVAEAVARRCRHVHTITGVNSPKTPVQCRHKMEKLRKRYRSEKKRPHRTSWVHFREMDAMEMGTPSSAVTGSGGPPTAAARSKVASPATYSDDNEDEDSLDEEEDDDGEDFDKNGSGNNANDRSIQAVMSKTNGGSAMGNLRFQIPKAVRSKVSTPRGGADDRVSAPPTTTIPKSHHSSGSHWYLKDFPGGWPARKPSSVSEEMRKGLEERRRMEKRGTMLGDMVAAVRTLGDGFIRVEEMKMEMARDMEKVRMEMELKRTEMILESQRQMVDAFVRGFTQGNKKRA